MITAYIDESGGSGLDPENVYILAAAIPLHPDLDAVRNELRAIKPPAARKLHWYEASAATRADVMDCIARFESVHVVVVSVESAATKPERHRRLCMRVLLARLDQLGVTALTFESRGAGSNHRDRNMVKMLKVERALSPEVTVTHRDGPFEPLLWIPDAICGAAADRRVGRNDHLLGLEGAIEWIERGP